MDTYKSEQVTINSNIDTVYAKLSNPASFKAIENLPPEAKEKISSVKFDSDSITIVANPVGEVKLSIVERVELSRIVFAATQSPVPLQAVISLEKIDDYKTAATAELCVELNAFLRPMLSKPLTEGAKKFGELLTVLPYNAI